METNESVYSLLYILYAYGGLYVSAGAQAELCDEAVVTL